MTTRLGSPLVTPPLVIAIDGPSSSGKSSVSRAVATKLGIGYLDTGAMYRALTWWVLERGLDVTDEALVEQASRDLPLVMVNDPQNARVSIAGRAVDAEIRGAAVTGAVSAIARNLGVRAELCRRQRELIDEIAAETGGVVAEGRDITTVVAPDADVRILLTASEQVRLARRSRELHGDADAAHVAETRSGIVDRDAADSTVAEFTTAADGVITLDTTALDLAGSVAAVLAIVAAHRS